MALRVYELKKGRDLRAETGSENPYKTKTTWPDPLPKDRLLLMQEIQQRMQMPYPLITPPMALSMLGEEDIPAMLAHINDWIALMQPQMQPGLGTQSPDPRDPNAPELAPENPNPAPGQETGMAKAEVETPRVQQPANSLVNVNGPG